MADICHDFPIKGSAAVVFAAISTPEGLDSWWTKTCQGTPREGAEYDLGFGQGYDWRALVTQCAPESVFELKMVHADDDWRGSSLNFKLTGDGDNTQVVFRHSGWPEENEHYRISCYCWAMYLRHLKRYVESGVTVAYEERLDV
jgi:uncharacterized protein YndB with AHSA1/START domain